MSQTPPLRRPAVFLDRDGTLNRQVIRDGKPFPPQSLAQFELFPDVAGGCRALAQAGFALVVATNQPDVGRGDQRREEVEAMHARLISWVPEIECIEVCYDPGRGEPSRRRKPETGMITDAAEALSLELGRSWMVGDRWRDIDCGKRAGLRTVFIDFGYAEELREQPDFIVRSFADAVSHILSFSSRPT
ncbi:D-glycero-alpha-D-manno-heptose-1,7-bisphosphate 7-phosphatase [Nibricoccus sp. IMCC34717]|uniref:D-glycero-alpha-D-manno-heptose-1,7-bisphosphate 7-phosphatase n=1 Tax=Nibricoccus sp. IMCC34717 TaxID=3034021 RepID=UPI00384FE3C1